MDLKKVGQIIKELRNEKKLTQVQLGELSDCSRSHVAQIERGAYPPSLDTLDNIAKALGVSLSYIMLKAENIIPDDYELAILKIKNEFPAGITVLKKAIEELSNEQKKDMLELIEWFIKRESERKDD